MNYYPHHIGDFNNATRHLDRIERSVYRDMLDMYYDTEQPLTLDMKSLCRKLLARNEQESTAVEQVLNEFFTKSDQGWYHDRCEREIQEFHGHITAKSLAGKASAAKREAERIERLAKLNTSATPVEPVLNVTSTPVQQNPTAVQQPLNCVEVSLVASFNQPEPEPEPEPKPEPKPEETKTKAPAAPAATPSALSGMFDGLPSQLVADFKKLRAKKNAPVTATAMAGMQREADKAGLTLEAAMALCCERGWSSLKADWVTGSASARDAPGARQQGVQQLGRAGQATARAAEEWLKGQENHA